MSNPRYATVRDYVTVGHEIVAAIHVPDMGYCLSGLLVEVAPQRDLGSFGVIDNWQRLDALEAGYDRIRVTTTDGDSCWMYAI